MQKEVYEFISKKTGDPIIERRTCRVSGEEFAIFQGDVAMIETLSPLIAGVAYALPLPVISPRTRHQLHLMFQNKRHLYHATCALTGEKTISRVVPELGIKVYTNEAWASDAWEYTDYALDYHGGDPLPYIRTLAWDTPYQDLVGASSNIKNNARYTNHTADIVDSYCIFDGHTVEKSAYGTQCIRSQDVFDCFGVARCRDCYECTDCIDMFQSFFCYDCSGCSMSAHLIDCHGCSHCIGCTNLVQKEYHLFNKPVTKKEFTSFRQKLVQAGRILEEEKRQHIQTSLVKQAVHQLNTEQCIGENIRDSSHVFCSTHMLGAEHCRWCDGMSEVQDCWGVTTYGHSSSRLYNAAQVGRYSSQVWMCSMMGKGEDMLYCIDTKKSKHCFGCVNIKEKEYCIFNKQYTQQAYEELVPKLIQYMQKTHMWGRFFGPECSIFPYNDTDAHDLYPPKILQYPDGSQHIYHDQGHGTMLLSSTEGFVVDAVLDLGGEEIWQTKRRLGQHEIDIPDSITTCISVPQSIHNVDDTILGQALICEVSGRPFRIVAMELAFYRRHQLPLPRRHPDIRHTERCKKRPGRELYLRTCNKTGEQIVSVYPEGVPFKVYSEEAYKQEVYG